MRRNRHTLSWTMIELLEGWPRGQARTRTELSVRGVSLRTLRALEQRGMLIRTSWSLTSWRRPMFDRRPA